MDAAPANGDILMIMRWCLSRKAQRLINRLTAIKHRQQMLKGGEQGLRQRQAVFEAVD